MTEPMRVMSEKQRTLLIVEDDPALQKQMRWAFDACDTVVADDRESAIAQLRRHEPAVVTMDLGLPPAPDDVTEGFQLLREMLALAPDTKVIVLTGQHDRENAVRAIGLGAYDFFAKPFEPELLSLTIERAFRMHDLQVENARLAAVVHGIFDQRMQRPDDQCGRIMGRDALQYQHKLPAGLQQPLCRDLQHPRSLSEHFSHDPEPWRPAFRR